MVWVALLLATVTSGVDFVPYGKKGVGPLLWRAHQASNDLLIGLKSTSQRRNTNYFSLAASSITEEQWAGEWFSRIKEKCQQLKSSEWGYVFTSDKPERKEQNRAGCPWAGSYHNKDCRLVWKSRPNSCPLGPGLKVEQYLWNMWMNWAERRKEEENMQWWKQETTERSTYQLRCAYRMEEILKSILWIVLIKFW